MKKILVPVDGSRLSLYVVELSSKLAAALKSQITLLTVIPINNLHVGESICKLEQTQAMINAQKIMREEYRKNASKILDLLGEKIEGHNIFVEKLIKSGIPDEEILKEAEAGQYDMIIIGNRGFSSTRKFLLGSVSKRVISEAKCPVLVAKEP